MLSYRLIACASAVLQIGLCFNGTVFAELPVVRSVEFVVGDYLKSEGGSARAEDFPFRRPFGIDFDTSGTMYIVELEGGRVFTLDPNQAPQLFSGDGSASYIGDGGPARDATYNGMHNLAVSRRNVAYIADSWNHCVREIDLENNQVRTFAGTGEAGFSGDGKPAAEAQFDFLMCVSLDPAEQALYVADLKNRRIRSINLQTSIVRTIAGNGEKGVPRDGTPATEAPLGDPRAVAVDHQNRVYVLERGYHALRRVNSDGTIDTVLGTGKPGWKDGVALQAQINAPKHLCVDDQDRVFIADEGNAAIRCYDPNSGMVSTILGRGAGDPRVKLAQPHGVCLHGDHLYVVDTGHNRILKVEFEGSDER